MRITYILYTLVTLDSTTATYAYYIAILVAYNDPIEASLRLQESFFYIQRFRDG